MLLWKTTEEVTEEDPNPNPKEISADAALAAVLSTGLDFHIKSMTKKPPEDKDYVG